MSIVALAPAIVSPRILDIDAYMIRLQEEGNGSFVALQNESSKAVASRNHKVF